MDLSKTILLDQWHALKVVPEGAISRMIAVYSSPLPAFPRLVLVETLSFVHVLVRELNLGAFLRVCV